MSLSNSPVYLVDPVSDPVLIRIKGRASLHNSQQLKDFFQQSIKEGKRRFVVDFQNCVGMDSTFLGVLAGTAIDLRKTSPTGSLVFCRLGARNLELIRNLGLHRLGTVDPGKGGANIEAAKGSADQALKGSKATELDQARLCLDAHESLIEANKSNVGKFQDVISLLKDRLEEG
jgi:anti-anti-sigma regulatory factor